MTHAQILAKIAYWQKAWDVVDSVRHWYPRENISEWLEHCETQLTYWLNLADTDMVTHER